MDSIDFIEPYFYSTYYYIFFLVICWATVLYHIGSNTQKILHAESSPMQFAALVLTVMITLYLGLRPVSNSFVDTIMYSINYDRIDTNYRPISFHTEWLWTNFTIFCKRTGLNVFEYFLLIEVVYIGGMFVFAWKKMRANLWLMMLFFLIAFQAYNFGTNGIRNGMACGIELMALAFLADAEESKFNKYLAFFLMFLALGIHRSTMLPTVAALATYYYVKDTKLAIRFWLVSIAISLVTGSAVERVFVSLGFDDRMESYSSVHMTDDMAQYFSSTGFRWDFLMYSAAPVAMIWYVTRYRQFTDRAFTMFANTYLLCNAFWIMVIRSTFSNRFAYLSWFIYPIVIAYPLLRMNLWKDQDRKTALIFFLYSGFSFFMFFVYYFGSSGFRGFDIYWWKRI